jgi:hypothetical protein
MQGADAPLTGAALDHALEAFSVQKQAQKRRAREALAQATAAAAEDAASAAAALRADSAGRTAPTATKTAAALLCVVCHTAERSVSFAPCRHLVVSAECDSSLRPRDAPCPQCLAPVATRQLFFATGPEGPST